MKLSEVGGQPSNTSSFKLSDVAKVTDGSPDGLPAYGNILQRAASAVQQQFVPHTGGNPIMDSAMNGMQTATNSISPMVSPFWSIAHGIKSDLTKDALPNNPIGAGALDIATDPETLMGLKGVGEVVANKVGDVAEGTGSFFKGLGDRKLIKSGTSIQSGVRDTVMNKFLGRTKQFDEALSALPETTHDITPEMNKLKNMAETNPAIKDAIENSPIAKKLLYGSESGEGAIVDEFGKPLQEQVANQSDKIVSTRDLQNLRNQLGKNFDYTDPGHDWQLGRSLGDLRLNQAAPFPEEMGAMAKDYKDTINHFGVVKPYLRESRLGSALLKGFGGEGGSEVRNSLGYFLGEKGKDINNIYQSGQTAKRATEVAGATGIGGLGLWGIKKLTGH